MDRLGALPILIVLSACGDNQPPALHDAGAKDFGFEPYDGAIRLDSGVHPDAELEDSAEDAAEDAGLEDAGADAGGEEIQHGALIVSELSTSGDEWIELYNASAASLEVTAASLSTHAGTFVIRAPSDPTGAAGTPVTLAPGRVILGYPNPAIPSAIPADAGFVFGAPGGAPDALADLGDTIAVRAHGMLEDRVDYDGFPLVAGRATQLGADALDAAANDDPRAWCVPIFRASTPGAPNSSCHEIVISEVTYAGGPQFVELAGPGGARLDGVTLEMRGAITSTRALGGTMPLDGLYLIDNLTLDGGPMALELRRGGALLDAFAWGNAAGEGTPVADLTTEVHAADWARDDAETDTQDNRADFHHDPSPTPGARNGAVAFAVTRLDPDDAIAGSDTIIRIEGNDFTDAMTVTLGGDLLPACTFLGPNTLECAAPYPAGGSGNAERSDLTVSTRPEVGASVTLTGGFTWTTSNNETDLPEECDYCVLQYPPASTTTAGMRTELIYGRVYEAGLTDVSAGQAPGILAELGYGPVGSDPSGSNAWIWVPAIFNTEYGNDDEYMQRLTVPAPGSYLYTYRWSLDGGLTWSYSDLDGAGYNPDLSFSAQALGTLTVD